MAKKIYIIVGSTRAGRVGRTIAEWFYQQAKNTSDAAFEIVDLADWDLPLLNEPIPAKFAPPQYDHSKNWAAKIAEADGFVFVTAEHNHSIPASLKNAIDYVYHEWGNKPVAFVSYGWHGGKMAVKHLTDIATNLEMKIVPEQANITFSPAMFDQQNQLADPEKDLAPYTEAATAVAKSFS
jgi:NAD(P)H-dependent FMN reductase